MGRSLALRAALRTHTPTPALDCGAPRAGRVRSPRCRSFWGRHRGRQPARGCDRCVIERVRTRRGRKRLRVSSATRTASEHDRHERRSRSQPSHRSRTRSHGLSPSAVARALPPYADDPLRRSGSSSCGNLPAKPRSPTLRKAVPPGAGERSLRPAGGAEHSGVWPRLQQRLRCAAEISLRLDRRGRRRAGQSRAGTRAALDIAQASNLPITSEIQAEDNRGDCA